MYEKTTNNVRVRVCPTYLDEQSSPAEGNYVWAYEVEIENLGEAPVQLLNRYWRITDGAGQTQEVRGPGVVGEQPVIDPGDSFSYTSGCPLRTPSGIMVGTYEMLTESGEHFLVDVPAFSLDSPHERSIVN